MKFTIKYKLASLILIIVIPVFILSTQHYTRMLARNKQLINSRNQEIASAVAQDLDHVIKDSLNTLLPLARHPAVVAKDTSECNRLFASLIPSFTEHLNILAAGMDGCNYGSGVKPLSAQGLNYGDREWFRKGCRGTPIVGELHLSKLFGVPAVMMAAPVFGPGGRQTGVLGFPLSLVKVNERLASLWKFPPDSSIRVLDAGGNILIDTLRPRNIGSRETDPGILRKIAFNQKISEEDSGADGITRLYSYAPLSQAPWTVVVGVPSQEAYRAVSMFALNYLATLLLVGFAATALAFFLVRRINGNVALLTDGLREIEQGNLHYRLALAGNDELAAVAASFNRMTEERMKADTAVREAKEKYRKLYDDAPDMMQSIDIDGKILICNKTEAATLGYDQEEIVGSCFTDFIVPGERDGCREKFRRLVERGSIETESTLQAKDGRVIPVLVKAKVIYDEQGRFLMADAIFRDVTELKRTEAALRENEKRLNHLAHHDPLTNLPNRILFHDRLRQAMAKASRSNQQVAVLFLDLDRFKNINDTLGHKTGDLVLCKMARLLKGLVREADTVARLGGDEFLLILEGLDDLTYAGVIAQKLLSDLSLAIFMDGQELYVTASIGISIYPADSDSADGLMKCADIAMYRAKDRGRNTYQFYTPDMNARAHDLLRLESSLRRALEHEQLVLYYQPQIDIATGKLVGLEALVRWQHPSEGMMLPGEFIQLAEETGLIVPIGEWVLRTACRQIRIWQEKGHPPVHVSVNISGRQFRHMDLVRSVASALEEMELDPRLLSLEITESVIMHEVESTMATLHELNRMGVQLAIDDFGTGYSSLGYLKRFPIAKLKIDRSFIRDVTSDPNDAAIVSSIIALGLGMNMEVIAEGIETEEQLSFLCDKGCRTGQGFLFSRPLPAAEIAGFLREAE
ncbi:MAG: EAL domain-containing protein [Geobacteraceae bacterium]|nr:EAL domain-containing protein [Geobacteraceae bacterium]